MLVEVSNTAYRGTGWLGTGPVIVGRHLVSSGRAVFLPIRLQFAKAAVPERFSNKGFSVEVARVVTDMYKGIVCCNRGMAARVCDGTHRMLGSVTEGQQLEITKCVWVTTVMVPSGIEVELFITQSACDGTCRVRSTVEELCIVSDGSCGVMDGADIVTVENACLIMDLALTAMDVVWTVKGVACTNMPELWIIPECLHVLTGSESVVPSMLLDKACVVITGITNGVTGIFSGIFDKECMLIDRSGRITD